MFKIERPLTGLLNILRLQSQGNVPHDLIETVQPVIDVERWAFANTGIRVESRSGTAALGTVATLTLAAPWILVGGQVEYFGLGTADYCIASIQVNPNGLAGDAFTLAALTRFGSSSFMNTAAAGEVERSNYNLNVGRGIYLPVGTIINLNCSAIVTAGVMGTVGMNVLYYRLSQST